MLKNEDTLQLAEEVAEALIKYEKGQERLTKRKNEVEELWQSYSRQQLIDKLAAIVDEEPKVAKTMNKAVDQLMTKIPQDMYRLFLTLVKFKYHYYQSN
jgi:Ni,Fe-hydrogenase I large subunit